MVQKPLSKAVSRQRSDAMHGQLIDQTPPSWHARCRADVPERPL
jgi:hypothetical protein